MTAHNDHTPKTNKGKKPTKPTPIHKALVETKTTVHIQLVVVKAF